MLIQIKHQTSQLQIEIFTLTCILFTIKLIRVNNRFACDAIVRIKHMDTRTNINICMPTKDPIFRTNAFKTTELFKAKDVTKSKCCAMKLVAIVQQRTIRKFKGREFLWPNFKGNFRLQNAIVLRK